MPSRVSRSEEPGAVRSSITERRLAMLQAELAADPDPRRQACLAYELGALLDRDLGDEARAAERWLEAYRGHPPFRLPLFALLGLFQRRGSHAQREKLLIAEERSAASEAERASALLDRAILLAHHLDRPDEADALLDKAVREGAGRGAAAAWLEERARVRGDRDLLDRALGALERATLDEERRGLLRLDRASLAAMRALPDEAIAHARSAADLAPTRLRGLARLERLARAHGRVPELLESLERHAALAAAFAGGTIDGAPHPADGGFRDAADAARRAAALCWEASRIRLRHGDARGATEVLATAAAVFPEAIVLGQELVRALERVGDHAGAAQEARRLLDRGASGGYAAWLWFRVAAGARATGALKEAQEALERALDADPLSIPALGSLENALLDAGSHDRRIRRLEGRAGTADGRGRVLAFWQAAQIAADDAGDLPRAERLYREAETGAAADERRTLRRERLGAALRAGAWRAARDASLALLDAAPGDEERSGLLRQLRDLALHDLGDPRDADAMLHRALDDPAAAAWAPDAARLRGAITRDAGLLAAAHGRLADATSDRWTRAAHRCAAARALARAGDADAAIPLLEAVVRETPGHPYAAPLLAGLLASRGDGGELVRLLRANAEAPRPAHASEAALLRAGAAAEARGDVDAAIEAYQEATDWDPTSRAPLDALRRLGRVEGRPEIVEPAIEALAAREVAAGTPGDATLELGEHRALAGDDPSLAEGPLLAALDRTDLAPGAALAATLLPPGARGALPPVEAVLEAHCGAPARDLADRAAAARRALDELAEPDGARARALTELAGAASSASARRALLFAAFRAALVDGGRAQAAAIADRLRAEDAASAEARTAAEEIAGAGTSAGWRALAEGCIAPHRREAFEAAAMRARLVEGDAAGALAALDARVRAAPDDLAAWESLRAAAIEVGDHGRRADACLVLAEELPDDLAAALLEEAGACLAALPGREAEATAALERAIRVAPSPPTGALARLDALLAQRGDPRGRADLVEQRVAATADPGERASLLVRKATLLAEAGDRGGAERALEGALAEDPGRRETVERLAALREEAGRPADAGELLLAAAAGGGDPGGRLAEAAARLLLGAGPGHADRAGAALALLAEEPVDRTRWLRLADLAEASGAWDVAATALRAAARSGDPTERRAVHGRLAELATERLGDADLAREALANLHALAPDDASVLERRLGHLEGEARRATADDAVRRGRALLAHDPLHPGGLALLAVAAAARGDGAVSRRARALADVLARPAAASAEAPPPLALPEHLGDDERAKLRARGDAGPLADLARAASELLAQSVPLDVDGWAGSPGAQQGAVPAPVRAALAGWAAVFGLEPPDVQAAPGLGDAVRLVPGRRGRPVWLVGPDVRAPLSQAQRFAAARWSFALRDGVLPIVARPAVDGALPILALGAALDVPMLGAAGRAEVPALARAVSRAMPRRTRRALAEQAALATEHGADVEAWALWAHASCLRAGVLGSDDPRVVLAAASGAPFDPDTVRASPLGRELARFLVSDELAVLAAAWSAPAGSGDGGHRP